MVWIFIWILASSCVIHVYIWLILYVALSGAVIIRLFGLLQSTVNTTSFFFFSDLLQFCCYLLFVSRLVQSLDSCGVKKNDLDNWTERCRKVCTIYKS